MKEEKDELDCPFRINELGTIGICKKEYCSWWVEDRERCAILDIAMSITEKFKALWVLIKEEIER